jgi:hypothetical protein
MLLVDKIRLGLFLLMTSLIAATYTSLELSLVLLLLSLNERRDSHDI